MTTKWVTSMSCLNSKKAMNNAIETTIFLSNIDAEKFKLFVLHYDTFSILLEKGVFNQRSASISLDFDHNAVLQNIRRNDLLFSRRHEGLH